MKLLNVFFVISILCFNPKCMECRRLREVPADILQIVFEHLTLPDLLNVVDSDEYLVEPAIWAFRHNFAREQFKLEGHMFWLPNKRMNFSTAEQSDSIDIWDYDVVIKVLNYFGDSISRLVIDYDGMTPDQINNINRYICEKSVERLREIEFAYDQTELKSFKTFPNVENVSLRASKLAISIDLNEMFPKMCRLELKFGLTADSKLLSKNFPHLEATAFHLSDFTEEQIEIFLKQNPQIKSIHVGSCTSKFLQTINNTLPYVESFQLSNLIFDFFDSDIQPIHFVNLKKLSVLLSRDSHSTPGNVPIVFGDQLKEFELTVHRYDVSQEWLSFIREQSNLKSLKLIWAYGSAWELSYIAEREFRNLRSFTAIGVRISNREMEKFMNYVDKWEHLDRIHLQYADKSLMNDLNNGKYSNWTIETKNRSTNNIEITFSKKK